MGGRWRLGGGTGLYRQSGYCPHSSSVTASPCHLPPGGRFFALGSPSGRAVTALAVTERALSDLACARPPLPEGEARGRRFPPLYALGRDDELVEVWGFYRKSAFRPRSSSVTASPCHLPPGGRFFALGSPSGRAVTALAVTERALSDLACARPPLPEGEARRESFSPAAETDCHGEVTGRGVGAGLRDGR